LINVALIKIHGRAWVGRKILVELSYRLNQLVLFVIEMFEKNRKLAYLKNFRLKDYLVKQ